MWGVALIAYIGFNSFNQILAAQTVHSLYGGDSTLTMLVFTVLAVSLAVIGYDLIHLAQRWIAYILIGALFVFTVAVLMKLQIPAPQISLREFKPVPFLAQFFAAASYQIAWSIYVSDYSRYLPRNVGVAASFWWTYMGAFVGGAWMMLVGTLAASLYPSMEVATALRTVGRFGAAGFRQTPAVLLAARPGDHHFAELLRCFADALERDGLLEADPADSEQALADPAAVGNRRDGHRSGVDAQFRGEIQRVPGRPFVFVHALDRHQSRDFYLIRKGHYSVREIFNSRGMYGRWNWRGLWAYGIGFAAMIPFFSTESWKGPVARALGGADIAMLVGLPVSALVYVLACRSLDIPADRARAHASDLGLDPGSASDRGG